MNTKEILYKWLQWWMAVVWSLLVVDAAADSLLGLMGQEWVGLLNENMEEKFQVFGWLILMQVGWVFNALYRFKWK